jgi:hypothetical protein
LLKDNEIAQNLYTLTGTFETGYFQTAVLQLSGMDKNLVVTNSDGAVYVVNINNVTTTDDAEF